jgi:hypothetical protein
MPARQHPEAAADRSVHSAARQQAVDVARLSARLAQQV